METERGDEERWGRERGREKEKGLRVKVTLTFKS